LRWLINVRAEAAFIFRGAGLAAFLGLTGFIYGRNEMTDYDDDDDELALPERYIERAGETLAYRLMEYLEFLGVIGKDHVSYLRYPPIELIEDAEKALRDEI
jgi:hypothetical protein